jgi:hypothetical protein
MPEAAPDVASIQARFTSWVEGRNGIEAAGEASD